MNGITISQIDQRYSNCDLNFLFAQTKIEELNEGKGSFSKIKGQEDG